MKRTFDNYLRQYPMPPLILQGLLDYVDHGTPPGDFLFAVLSNDLMQALGRASHDSRAAIFQICEFVCNEMPAKSHGSPAKIHAWIEFKHKAETEARQ